MLYNQQLSGQVFGEDFDGDNISAGLVVEPQHGLLVFNSDGTFFYEPFGDFTGLDRFVYSWNDGLTSSVAQVVIVVYDNIWFFAEEDNLIITVEDLSHGVQHPLGQEWSISLAERLRFGQVTWSGSGMVVYQFNADLYEQVLDTPPRRNEESSLSVDTFEVLLRGGQVDIVREIHIVLNSFISSLDSISPPTRGDSSGRPIHEPQRDPPADLLRDLESADETAVRWFVMFVDEPRPNAFVGWHNGIWFGHASVGVVDTASAEVLVYGFHMNGLGRWLTSSFQGSVLDNRNYNFDIGRAWPIDAETFQKVKTWFNQQAQNPPPYTILGMNCFQWAIEAGTQAGVVDESFWSLQDAVRVLKFGIEVKLTLELRQAKRAKDMDRQRQIEQHLAAVQRLDPLAWPKWYFSPNIANALRTGRQRILLSP